MNKTRRQKLNSAISHLEEAKKIVTFVYDEEDNAKENLPENLQCSSRYDIMDLAVEHLDSALNYIDDATDDIKKAAYGE